MDFGEAIRICLRNDVKVYPVPATGGFKIEVSINEKRTTFEKIIKKKEVDEAMRKTYVHFAKQINS